MGSEVEQVAAAGGEPAGKPEKPAWKPERPLLLTQQQAALWLNVSERTIRNLIRKRKLIPKFIGRRCLLRATDVEKFSKKTAGA